MLKITILTVGTIKEKYMRDAINDYLTRMERSYKINVIECREQNTIHEEGDGQLAKIPENSFVIALDLAGKQLTSPELADLILRTTTNGVSHITFVIGGSDGIDPRIVERADFRLCLSKMTFTHQMARLILAEQIYRAMKINNGEKYHK